MEIKRVAYGGWQNCYGVTNGDIELVVTSDVGPRVIRYGFAGSRNLFKEHRDTLGQTGGSEWLPYGGHRLWAAPETQGITYAPDNTRVNIRVDGNGLEAEAPVEPSTGLQKVISVSAAAQGTNVRVTHRITNRGRTPVRLAAWAITQMAAGGAAIHQFPPRGPHPEHLLPTNPLVMWAYSDLSDPRWRFTGRHLILRQDAGSTSPQKLGSFNPDTLGAYVLDGELFLKRATAATPTSEYPDMGCSFETCAGADFIEIETLGPLRALAPGDNVEHVEEWWLKRDVRMRHWTDDEMDDLLTPPAE